MKSSKIIVDENIEKNKVGQGELYSPNHAIKINPKNNQHQNNNQDYNYYYNNNNNKKEEKGNTMVGKGVANEIKNKMSMVKERLMEKLAAASVPSDALENARHYFESVIKDVTSAAQGITKDALHRIKSHLADILPSLSPSLTSKMVDDAEKEATTTTYTTREEDDDREGSKDIEITTTTEENYHQDHKGKAYASPTSSLFSTLLLKPSSKL